MSAHGPAQLQEQGQQQRRMTRKVIAKKLSQAAPSVNLRPPVLPASIQRFLAASTSSAD
jgi:hypothetical protein